MKKLAAMVFLVLLFALGTAFADTQGDIDKDVPLDAQIQGYLDKEAPQGYVTAGYIPRAGSSPYASMVLMQNAEGKKILYVFSEDAKGWSYAFHTETAIPQGSGEARLQLTGEDTVYIGETDGKGEYARYACYYMDGKGNWQLLQYFDRDRKMSVEISLRGITYYGGTDYMTRLGQVAGTIQQDMRYVNLKNIPSTIEKAREKYTTPPEIPAGTLTARSVRFTGGKKYAVYSGPGEAYARGAGGKASVSTNDWIQVFGREYGWIMIQYAIDADHYRIGYIPEKALPKGEKVEDLTFPYRECFLSRDAQVTDDPLFSVSSLASLPTGSRVLLLGTMDDWAYVESMDEESFRGFVPISSISQEEEFSRFLSQDGTVYDWFTIKKLHFGEDHRVTAVTGNYEREVEGEECVESEQAVGSERTYPLAADFKADMLKSMSGKGMAYTRVTDLYTWYVDCYLEGQDPGRAWIFTCDLTDEENERTTQDFWFVTTQIRLNDRGEIEYMRYVFVPWG